MTPTEVLVNEHKVILAVLDAAEREAKSIGRTGRMNADRVAKMLDFFKNFADRCHHAKEEKLLFERMKLRGVPANAGPIAVMLDEHATGRQHLKAVTDAMPMASSGEPGAVETVRRNLSAYVTLLRAHIGKEDNVLYPFADNILTDEDQKELAEAFELVEKNEMGAGEHERFHRIAEEVSAE